MRSRTQELGCALPSSLVLLPENFDTAMLGEEFHFRSEASTVRKLLHNGGFQVERLNAGLSPIKFVHNRSCDWAVPAIFIGSELLKTNPDITSVIIDLIRDHIKDLFGGTTSSRRVSVEIIVESGKGRCRKVKYEGEIDGLKEITRMVKSLR